MKCLFSPAKKNLPCTRTGPDGPSFTVGGSRVSTSWVSTKVMSELRARLRGRPHDRGSRRTTRDHFVYSIHPSLPAPGLTRTRSRFASRIGAVVAASLPRMRLQSGADDRFEVGHNGAPAKELGREAGIGDQHRRVASPPRGIATRDAPPTDSLGDPNHLSHGMAGARAEVHRGGFAAGQQIFERAQMAFGQILDVDVIADRGPVRGRIIGSVNLDVRPLAKGRLQDERDEVRLR